MKKTKTIRKLVEALEAAMANIAGPDGACDGCCTHKGLRQHEEHCPYSVALRCGKAKLK